MKPAEEFRFLLEVAKAQGCKKIEIEGVVFHVEQDHEPKPNYVPEVKPEEIMNPMSFLDEYSDEEIMFYSTPRFDEIQKQKEAHKQKLAEEQDMRS